MPSSDLALEDIEEKTEVIYGDENIKNSTLKLLLGAKCTLVKMDQPEMAKMETETTMKVVKKFRLCH